MFFTFNAYGAETYYCDVMTGVGTPLRNPGFLKKIKLWFSNGVEKNETISGFRIVIDGDNSYMQNDNDPEKTPVLLFANTDEKAELLLVGTVASSIYSIDKIHKKVLQAKNGILPTSLRHIFNIERPYQMILSGDCR